MALGGGTTERELGQKDKTFMNGISSLIGGDETEELVPLSFYSPPRMTGSQSSDKQEEGLHQDTMPAP